MAKFKKKKGNETPPISTASLPDIVFMLLFFFMVTTTMRDVSLKVRTSMPTASDVVKLEKKSLVSFIYVGPPTSGAFGTEPRIQLNDAYAYPKDIAAFIEAERASKNENDRPFMISSLKVDKETKMGIVSDIKQELRKVNALKINYSSRKTKDAEVLKAQ